MRRICVVLAFFMVLMAFAAKTVPPEHVLGVNEKRSFV